MMYSRIGYEVEVDIAYGVKIKLRGFADVDQAAVAQSLRELVASAYGDDDAGCDYFYDQEMGIVSIGGHPGWWDSKNPLHWQLLKMADALDGKDFSFDYAMTLDTKGNGRGE